MALVSCSESLGGVRPSAGVSQPGLPLALLVLTAPEVFISLLPTGSHWGSGEPAGVRSIDPNGLGLLGGLWGNLYFFVFKFLATPCGT